MSATLLQVNGLHHAYDRTAAGHAALRGIDLGLPRGEFVALIGANGSGKSTLLRCIAGILKPCAGRIVIDGLDMTSSAQAAKARLGFAVDPALLPLRLTGRECLRLFAGARGLSAIPQPTFAFAERLAFDALLDVTVDRYSLGMRQKLAILLGLLGEPPLLLLDEPLNGLDPASALVFKQHLRTLTAEQGTTVLLATHALDVAGRDADRVLLMVEGCLLRDWNRTQLDGIRSDPALSLEQAMADAVCAGGVG